MYLHRRQNLICTNFDFALRFWLFFSLFMGYGTLYSQSSNTGVSDSTKPYFTGGDNGFYKYLEDRLMAQGVIKPFVEPVGEIVSFEFIVLENGMVDSLKITQCFNLDLCTSLRMILTNLGDFRPAYSNGVPIPTKMVYLIEVSLGRESYQVRPVTPQEYQVGSTSKSFKVAIALVALVAMLIAIIK